MRGGRGLPNDMTTQVIAGLEDLLTAGLRSADSADPLPGLVSYLQGALARREGKCETEVSPAASPEWTVKGWLAPLGVSSCVALALLPDAPLGVTPNEHAALRALELTSAEAIAEHLRAGGLLEKIAELLLPSLVALSESPEAAAAPDAIDRQTKFAGNELDFSGLDVFFDGLEERVGVPRANTKGYMKNEHTSEADARCEFTTNNYGITTTSAVEWAFVVDADGSYPTEAEGRLDRSMCRKPVPLADILARGEEKNAQLRGAKMAELVEAELIGARLYTGPMCALPASLLSLRRRADHIFYLAGSRSTTASCAASTPICSSCGRPSFLSAARRRSQLSIKLRSPRKGSTRKCDSHSPRLPTGRLPSPTPTGCSRRSARSACAWRSARSPRSSRSTIATEAYRSGSKSSLRSCVRRPRSRPRARSATHVRPRIKHGTFTRPPRVLD